MYHSHFSYNIRRIRIVYQIIQITNFNFAFKLNSHSQDYSHFSYFLTPNYFNEFFFVLIIKRLFSKLLILQVDLSINI